MAYKRVARQQREVLARRTTAGHKVSKKRKSLKKSKKKSLKNHKIDSKKNKHKSQ